MKEKECPKQELPYRDGLWRNNFGGEERTPTVTPVTPFSTILTKDFIKVLDSNSRIIDVGCGSHPKIAECSNSKRKISGVGIDVNGKEIDWVNKNLIIKGVEFIKMDATDIKFPNDSFTHAIACGIFGAVGYKRRKKMIAEIFRVLKPGGILVSTDFKFDSSDSALKKYETDKYEIENVLGETAELGDRIVYGPAHNILFIVKHAKEEEQKALYRDAGFELLTDPLREDLIPVKGLEDEKITMRVQYTVMGRKPQETEKTNVVLKSH